MVDEAERWQFWLIDGGDYQPGVVIVSAESDGNVWVRGVPPTETYMTQPIRKCASMESVTWRPVPTVAELLALSALPQRVAEMALKQAAEETNNEALTDDTGEAEDKAYNQAIQDVLAAMYEIDPAAIVAACLK